eukprot:scaffold144329_cov23-Tisochrysis_lutea.AAC.1
MVRKGVADAGGKSCLLFEGQLVHALFSVHGMLSTWCFERVSVRSICSLLSFNFSSPICSHCTTCKGKNEISPPIVGCAGGVFESSLQGKTDAVAILAGSMMSLDVM